MLDPVTTLRPRMMSIAYRMLGSVADAEDAVQDAFLRLHTTSEVTSPEGFLVQATTRRCIDQLRTKKRTEYIGPWVPEPVETHGRESVLSDSLTQAFLLLLEKLTPEERAAFLLRTVFDYEYAEIGEVVGKSEVAVRQLVSRARRQLGLGERKFRAEAPQADSFAERFVAACKAGDVKAVEEMLTSDIEIHSDGGGKVSAARVVIHGRDRAARFLTGVFHKQRNLETCAATVNGEPGLVFKADGKVMQVASLWIEERIRAIYITVNPDKLSRWSLVEIE